MNSVTAVSGRIFQHLVDHGLQEAAADGRLTYIQALEQLGHEVPQSPRERLRSRFART